MVVEVLKAERVDVLHCRFSGVAIAYQRQQLPRRAEQRQMRHQRFHSRIGYVAVGMEDPGSNFDQFPRMTDEHDLAKSQPHRLFNHVADKVAHGDHHVGIDAHLFADETLTMITRHQNYPLQSGGTFDFQPQR